MPPKNKKAVADETSNKIIHPQLSLDSSEDAFQDYVKNHMTEDEYIGALEGKYKLEDRWSIDSILESSKHNTPEVNDRISFPHDLSIVANVPKVSSNKIRELSNSKKHNVVAELYDPEVHTDPELSETFLKNHNKQSFLDSIQNAHADKVPKYAVLAQKMTKENKNADLHDNKKLKLSDGSSKRIMSALPEDEAFKLALQKGVSGYNGFPDNVKQKFNDHFLGITGGTPAEELDPEDNFNNWNEGPGHGTGVADWLAKKGDLTDAQAEHIMRHGTDSQQFDMFHENKKINPAIKTQMYHKWVNDHDHHGYDLNNYKDMHEEANKEGMWEDYDIMDTARDMAADSYSMHDFFSDQDHKIWGKALSQNNGNTHVAATQFIKEYYDGDEEKAYEDYDESLRDSIDDIVSNLGHEKYYHNALTEISNLPDDMVNHESFAPTLAELKLSEQEKKDREQREREAEEQSFHDERIPLREKEHPYAPGQQQAELLHDTAAAQGGSVDIGTMHKLYPSLKETWKQIFGSKGKMNTDEIQSYIDAMPKTKWAISHGKWNGGGIQNLNQQDQTIFRLDHSDESMKQIEDAGVRDLFQKVSELSRNSGHPTKSQTIGWARVDTTNPKHWVIDEMQTDYGKGVRQFLKDHDKSDEAEGIDKIVEIQKPWHEALVNHVINMAKKHGVERISTHTPESKSVHTGAGKVHSVYKESYGAMPGYGFHKVDANDVDALTIAGKRNLSLIPDEPSPRELQERASDHSEAAQLHLHNAFQQQKILADHPDLGLVDKTKLHAGVALSKEMAKKHKEAGLKLDPDHEDLNNLQIEPKIHPFHAHDTTPMQATSDYDKMLDPPKVKKQSMQTLDLTGKLPTLKKSTSHTFVERMYNYYEYIHGIHALAKSQSNPDSVILRAAENGDWHSAIKAASLLKRNPMYQNIFDRLATLQVPQEHLNDFLKNVVHPFDHDKTNHNALFELVHNLHPNLQHEHLLSIANSLSPFSYMERKRLKSHNNWDPSSEPGYNQKLAAFAFWNSYERAVKPEHFSLVADHFGYPNYLQTHRGQSQDPNKMYLQWSDGDNIPQGSHWVDTGHFTPYIGIKHALIPVHDIKNALDKHSQNVQNLLLQSYHQGNPHELNMRTFNGKQFIKLYRGVGGDQAEKLKAALGHNPEDNSVQNKSITAHFGPFSSWSQDIDMAKRFAHARGDHLGGHPMVIEQWHPIESIMHAGFVKTHPGFQNAHEDEKEIVVGHPSLKHKIKATDIHLGQDENQFNFTKPQVKRKG